ncbi:MAG TPA: hypothetical protein VGB70_03920 [Allosphingosinicella sp.]
MRHTPHSEFFAAPRSEILFRLAGGTPWRFTMSAGCERFIGFYPRVPGIEADGGVFAYRRAEPAGL